MRYSRWEDAYVEKRNLLRFTESGIGTRYLTGFFDSLNAQHDPNGRVRTELLYQIQRQTLTQADPIYVSAEITEIIDKAWESFEPEKVLATDLFTACGFLLFPRPILMPDAAKNKNDWVPVRAMAWLPLRADEGAGMASGGVAVSWYTDHDDDVALNRYPAEGKMSSYTRLSLVHYMIVSFNRETWKEDITHILPGEDEEDVRTRQRAQWLFPQTVWRIGSQFVKTTRKLPRGMRREMQRKEEEKPVTVITLRRSSEPMEFDAEPGSGPRVQFVVRGHWRNQWYASIKEHRQIWIEPYIKGPEDGEFRFTDRVYEFVR